MSDKIKDSLEAGADHGFNEVPGDPLLNENDPGGPFRSYTLDSVISKLEGREAKGIEKYGVTVDRGDLTPLEWVRHAQEEAMDLCLYLERVANALEVAEAIVTVEEFVNSTDDLDLVEEEGLDWLSQVLGVDLSDLDLEELDEDEDDETLPEHEPQLFVDTDAIEGWIEDGRIFVAMDPGFQEPDDAPKNGIAGHDGPVVANDPDKVHAEGYFKPASMVPAWSSLETIEVPDVDPEPEVETTHETGLLVPMTTEQYERFHELRNELEELEKLKSKGLTEEFERRWAVWLTGRLGS